MITIEDLRFQYPRSDFQLVIPELSVADGEKVAIIGPSGCGKTTLLKLISGIESPLSGSIEVCGKQLSSLDVAGRRNFRIADVGQVFQQFELVEYLRGRDNIKLPFLINSSLRFTREHNTRLLDLANAMGLNKKHLSRHPSQLSQGEQQRIAICRALITQPRLMLADEPTGNLDPANKATILKLLFEQCGNNNQGLVVVTHDHAILDGFDRTIDFRQYLQGIAE